MRKKEMKIAILLVTLAMLGCVGVRAKAPELNSMTTTKEGGFCIDRQDSIDLLIYIKDIERGATPCYN